MRRAVAAVLALLLGAGPAATEEEVRRRLLAAEGGTAESEKVVAAALRWLADHQEEDGRIDADGFDRRCPEGDRCDGLGGGHHGERVRCAFDGAVTSVATSAWIASGSTRSEGPYAENLARAVEVCLRESRGDATGFDSVWNIAFGAWALADARIAWQDQALDDAIAAAVESIEAGQSPDGGWRYLGGPIGDLPTTSCVLCFLARARTAGAAVDAARIDRALAFLDARVDPESGRSEYHDGAEALGYTPTTANAAGALAARALLGRLAGVPHLAKQWGALDEHRPRWTLGEKTIDTPRGPVVAQTGRAYPYAWYFATLAQFQRGGAAWSSWFGALKTALAKGQRKDGHRAGSWDPVGPYGLAGGRAFTTAICALMLQSPYRAPRIR